ncbi:hypothetical protein [Flammeovirga agarivorans]|uniref:Uncharacterized protein n=1 Tax=Flammeovirga agarivorans TaxID=2726742 RepID=A0A7X8XYU5_9BACT|nr:hypothetical protein [Flammeovirga agarivorans]NLR94564.1 hypothetical protein [Flammeovirga agarivorans]
MKHPFKKLFFLGVLFCFTLVLFSYLVKQNINQKKQIKIVSLTEKVERIKLSGSIETEEPTLYHIEVLKPNNDKLELLTCGYSNLQGTFSIQLEKAQLDSEILVLEVLSSLSEKLIYTSVINIDDVSKSVYINKESTIKSESIINRYKRNGSIQYHK